jgi:asparagine synthase (glutamine-hydrolysing)
MDRLRHVRGGGSAAASWLRPAARAAVAGAGDDAAWWSEGRPRWQAQLAWLLTDGRAAMGMQDHLRRIAAESGVRAAHPLLDVDLIELMLGLPPQLGFDPELDRPLLRRAMTGLLPDAVRLRADKVSFNALLLDALVGPEAAAIDTVLTHPTPELAAVVEPGALRRLWHAGPSGHPHGGWAWSLEVWRAFSAETWLRRGSGAHP